MRHTQILRAAMVKWAKPRWARVLEQGLSQASKERLAGLLPSGVSRQLGRGIIGSGSEGVVVPGFTGGGIGDSVLKKFDVLAHPGVRKGMPPKEPALFVKDQVEGMRAFPDLFARVHHPTRAGYAMEPLSHKPPPGVVETNQQATLMDNLRKHLASPEDKGPLRREESAAGVRYYLQNPTHIAISERPRKPYNWHVFDAFSNSNKMWARDGRFVSSDPQLSKIVNPAIDRLAEIRRGKLERAEAAANPEIPMIDIPAELRALWRKIPGFFRRPRSV